MSRFMLTIGRIAAIPIRIHWSWMAVLLIVVGILSQIYAGIAPGAGAWIMAASAGLLLCVSVVLHELGHALAARRYHFTVRSITLFAVGGVAEIDAENTNPIQELLVAVAGPLVSLLLALLAGLAQRPAEGWWPAILAGHLPLDNWIDLLAALVFLALGCVLLGQRRWSEGVLVLLGTLIPLSSGLPMSQRRYVWVLFPVFTLLARWGERTWVDRAIMLCFALGLGLFVTLFANWYWVG